MYVEHFTQRLTYGCTQFENVLNGKVIGEFICNDITYLGNIATDPWIYLSGSTHEYHKRLVTEKACLTENEMLCYGGQYAWHISALKIYDEPRELREFRKSGALSYDDWLYGMYNGKAESSYETYLLPFVLTRPPQSWYYVEEEPENV